jgi:hypothetical protein
MRIYQSDIKIKIKRLLEAEDVSLISDEMVI